VNSQPGKNGTASGSTGLGDRLVGIGAYVALLLFGLAQAVIGSFQYSRGPGPLVAICFALGMLATCVLGAWGMRTPGGALMPGVGWFVAAFVLASGTQGGSVLITATTAGSWFLYGGAAATAVGCVGCYLRWSRAGQSRRDGDPGAR
jgi:hypothetical protein